MLATADTSFLFALFGRDDHTPAAQRWAGRKSATAIIVTALSRYELENALRFAAFRKRISPVDASTSLAAIEHDLQSGSLRLSPCDYDAVLREARRLSVLHTLAGGHRSFDILHVATALVLKVDLFLTFDANQRVLAKSVGLAVGP
ncbi:MAG: PilT protein domain protein [Verrucomicrobia bacterium]|nr:PilT protein domain protein [Verrucomicrobiota bacterium]